MAHFPENILKHNEDILTRITALHSQLERRAPESRLNEIRADSETIIKDILAIRPFVGIVGNMALVNDYFSKNLPAGLLTAAERAEIAHKYSNVDLHLGHSRSISAVS